MHIDDCTIYLRQIDNISQIINNLTLRDGRCVERCKDFAKGGAGACRFIRQRAEWRQVTQNLSTMTGSLGAIKLILPQTGQI